MAVQWKISVSTILLIAAVLFILIFPQTLCNAPRINGSFSVYNAVQWLKTQQYTSAEVTTEAKPDNLPPPVKESAVSTTHGTGVWIPQTNIEPGDSVEVEISVVELIDESAFVKVTIAGNEVKWHRLEHYRAPLPERKWTLFAEVTNRNGAIGVGVAYKLFDVVDVDVSTAVSVSPQLDRVAVGIQLTKKVFGNVHAGIAGGYGLGANDGGYVSVLASIGL